MIFIRCGILAVVLATLCTACDSGTDQPRRQAEKPDPAIPEPPRPDVPYTIEIVADGLDFPTSVNFTPDGKLLILERGNYIESSNKRFPPRLKLVDPDTGNIRNIEGRVDADITTDVIDETFNGGALGLELDPDYAENGRIYVCYLYLKDPGDDDSGRNRLSSFTVRDNRLVNEHILIDKVPGSKNHNGCRVIMGSDKNLYYATGTGRIDRNAQNLDSLAGKILRIRPDGSIPPDNPFPGSPVWSYGHRNPQGLGFDPETGRLWSTEHGENTNDELNFIEAGKNYGWPFCVGEYEYGTTWGQKRREWWQFWEDQYIDQVCEGRNLNKAVYRPAVKSYYPHSTVAISDLVFYHGDAFPDWRGSLFFVTLKTGRLMRVILDGARFVRDEMLIDADDPENYGRLRDVTVGPDGYLYVITNVTNPNAEGAKPMNPRGGLLLRIRSPD